MDLLLKKGLVKSEYIYIYIFRKGALIDAVFFLGFVVVLKVMQHQAQQQKQPVTTESQKKQSSRSWYARERERKKRKREGVKHRP